MPLRNSVKPVVAGGYTKLVQVAKTRPNDTNTYAAGDVFNESTSAGTNLTFAGCSRYTAGTGVIQAATLIDSANQALKGSFELWLFNAAVTADNDNAVFTPTDAELLTLQAIIPFTNWYVGDATANAGGNAVSLANNLGMPFTCASGSTSLIGVIVVRNAYIPVAQSSLTFTLEILQD